MNESLPVSVIIPCYRCKVTIERAVKSVADQTRLPNEVILVDDCSSDGTLEVLQEIKYRYNSLNIKVIGLEKNSGPGAARNYGWELAVNPYIAFLDADDAWHRLKLEIQYKFMTSDLTIDICGHDRSIIKKGLLSENDADSIIIELQPTNIIAVHKRNALLRNPFACSTVMLKRNIKYRFQDEKYHSEDYLLWLTSLLSGLSIFYLKIPLTFSFKEPFGEGGLSKNLVAMQRGNLNTYDRLHGMGLLKTCESFFYKCFSLLKYTRRVVVSSLRRLLAKDG